MSRRGQKHVLFAGGGTGGHLFPGIAVARELIRRDYTARVVFAGSGRHLESRLLSQEGFSLEKIRVLGLVGSSPGPFLRGLAQLPVAFLDAARLLTKLKPDLVVGLGGYSSGPVLLLAALKSFPTMLLEQNVEPGVTNRLLSRFVRAAALSDDQTMSYFRDRGFVSGNPVRSGFFDAPPPRSVLPEARILVIGGSQGAHSLNLAMVKAVAFIPELDRSFRVIHQSGVADLELVREGYKMIGVTARVESFIDRMDMEMSAADIVVCRAGATTIAELAAAGRPAILVPFPNAANDHQRINAAAVERAGAAQVIDPNDMNPSLLARRLRTLIVDDVQRLALAEASRLRAKPDAVDCIVDRMESLMECH